MRLRAGARSDRGQRRTLNEDAYACLPPQGLFVVCDGMGGEAAGEVASQLTAETLVRELTSPPGETTPGEGFQPQTRCLEAALQLSNRAVYEESRRNAERAGMGTTAVCAWIRENLASLAHVGDSRAYLWRNQQLEQLTRDHSLVEEQVRAGHLTREQSRESEEQNVLLRALGRDPEVEIELAEVPLMTGDYLLLCSDGLTRMVSDSTLAESITSLREPQKICNAAVALANRNGGEDNITVVVVQVVPDSFWQRLWSGSWR